MPPRSRRRPVRRPALRVEALEPRLTPANSARIAIIGDFGAAGAGEASVASLVKSWTPDLIATTGDNNYPTGSAATIDANIGQYYHDYIGNYTGSYGAGSATNRFFPALGNHDWQTTSGTPALPTPYLNFFTLPGNERYYTVTDGPVQLFAIDSGNGAHDGSDSPEPDGYSSTSIQAQWLKAQLAASTATWKLVYFHHPAYSSGALGSNAVMQWPFQAWGATAVFAGSDHDYERLNENGMPYFVDGLGGESYVAFSGTPLPQSQVRYAANYGAMRIDASDTQIQFQFVSVTGAVIDTYTILASSSLASVTVSADVPAVAEPSAAPAAAGTFTVSRSGSTVAALTVNLSVGGTATNGIDYTAIPNTVSIPAGAASATVPVTPFADSLVEGNETVTLTIAASTAYNAGTPNAATMTILDANTVSSTLVPPGSVWKYLDDGTNQGTAWEASNFNDTAWKSGAAELGYGDGDEATVVGYGPDANNKYITTYFRQAFSVANAAAVTGLQLRLVRDDGAVVYLNGVEVFRSNMNPATPTYTTLAPVSLGPPDESAWVPASFGPAGLVTGVNVLAVEIHQASPDSSDVSFNLELDATLNTVGPPAPSTPALASGSDNGLDNDDHITSITTPTFTGTADAGSTVKLYSDGALVGTGTASNGVYTITANTLTNGIHAITATATDAAGTTSPASAALNVTIDTVSPTVIIPAVTPNPRSTAVGQVSIVFGEPVSGLDLADLSLSLNGGANLLGSSQTLVTADGITWTLGNLSGLTSSLGTNTFALTAAGSGITDKAANPLAVNASMSWQVVPAAVVIDDGAAGFTLVGSWKVTTGQGYQSDFRFNNAGNGSRTATWTFTGLTAGQYRVSATWVAAGNRATNSPFTVLQGGTVLGTAAVNQRLAPADFSDSGATWKDLGGPYTITGSSVTVRLTDKANGVVVADAVRVQLIAPTAPVPAPTGTKTVAAVTTRGTKSAPAPVDSSSILLNEPETVLAWVLRRLRHQRRWL